MLLLVWGFTYNPVFVGGSQSFFTNVDSDRLEQHVKTLSSPPYRSIEDLAALEAAAQYIKQEWENQGYQVHEQVYQVQDKSYKNLIVSYIPPGPEPRRIVVGAHYDTCMNFPGADDNASGVAGLLELTRAFQENKPQLSYRVDFVAWTLEEPPYYDTQWMGSYVHAKSLYDAQVPLEFALSLEMIGYFSDEADSQSYPASILNLIYPTTGNFIAVIGGLDHWKLVRSLKSSMMKNSGLPVYSMNAFGFIPGIDYSDHRSYWAFEYPAVMVTDTSFYRNKNYHTPDDTWDKLDYKRMAEVVKGVYAAIVSY